MSETGAVYRVFSSLLISVFFLSVLTAIQIFLYNYIVQYFPFTQDSVIIEGNRMTDPAEIKALIGTERQTFFRVNIQEIKENTESLKMIYQAEVSRVLPDKIRISVKEKEPVIVISDNDRSLVLDQSGVIIEGMMNGGLPVLRIDGEINLDGNNTVKDPEFILLIKRLQRYQRTDEIYRIYYKKNEGFYFTFKDAPEVLFYTGVQVPETMDIDRMLNIRDEIISRGLDVKYVDIYDHDAIGLKEKAFHQEED